MLTMSRDADALSMSSDMNVLIPRRSHFHVVGIAAERPSDEGTLYYALVPLYPTVPQPVPPGHSLITYHTIT